MLTNIKKQVFVVTLLFLLPLKCFASLLYWNLFNLEGESSQSSVYVTYAALEDMLNDENRLGTFLPDSFGASQNVVGSGSDGSTFWSLFNLEGESTQSSVYVTYATAEDMLTDENRSGTFLPDFFGASQNVVGSGSDGTNYWSLFNLEGESTQSSVYVTYASLMDMLNDENRTGTFLPDLFGASQNVVGSGSDGTNYWSLFNLEGESTQSSVYVTYASLMDMLNDENRTGAFLPDFFGASHNVVGSGAFVVRDSVLVAEPGALWLMLSGLIGLLFLTTRKQPVA